MVLGILMPRLRRVKHTGEMVAAASKWYTYFDNAASVADVDVVIMFGMYW